MLRDNYNSKWDDINECVKFYSEWLGKDAKIIIDKITKCKNITEKIKVFDSFFQPVVYLKFGKPKWSMYGYDKH